MISKFNFDTLSDNNLKYRLLAGIKDKELRLDLQQLPDAELTLKKVISMMRAKENIQTSQNVAAANGDINAVSRSSYATVRPKSKTTTAKPGGVTHKQRHKQTKININGNSNIIDCGRCEQQHARKQCPAYGHTCRKCGKPNHFYS